MWSTAAKESRSKGESGRRRVFVFKKIHRRRRAAMLTLAQESSSFCSSAPLTLAVGRRRLVLL